MKIGILSFNNAHNFGALMQLYAMQKYLSGMGHDVHIINYRQSTIGSTYRIVKRRPSKRFLSKVLYILKYTLAVMKKPYLTTRYNKYEKFIGNFSNITVPYSSLKSLRKAKMDFDAIILGSDQIWNSGITKYLDPAYFGDFVDKKTIIISYAASLGSDQISAVDKPIFVARLRNIDYISIRERSVLSDIQQLTEKPISVVLDPTLLVDRNEFESLYKKPKYRKNYIYVHVHHYSAKAPLLVKVARFLSDMTGLPIVHNIPGIKFNKQIGTAYSNDPAETLSLLRDAQYVLSQSFHITVFALIYQKKFLVVAREKYNSRISDLLCDLDLERLIVTDINNIPDIVNFDVNYLEIQNRIYELRINSIDFIDKSISGKKNHPPDWFESQSAYSCYGCHACHDICPVGAIDMVEDNEGFFQPLIDNVTCIKCYKCRDVCIYNGYLHEKHHSKVYIAWQKEVTERRNSSSGGMFGAFSGLILESGGNIVGVKYDNTNKVTYDIVSTAEDCLPFRYSKYVEPAHNDIYKKTEAKLRIGELVLFSGSPCKIAGLYNYLGKEYDNLFTIDIICHCTSSPKLFDMYLKAKEKEENALVKHIRFRDKSVGWSRTSSATVVEFDNGVKETFIGRKSLYSNCYVSGYLAKRSCYECSFVGDNGVADITIGDFWGAESYFSKDLLKDGCSALKINSDAGMKLFEKLRDSLFLKEVSLHEMYENNHNWHIDITKNREAIFDSVINEDKDIIEVLKNNNIYYKKLK